MPHSRRNIALSVVAVLLLTVAALAITAHYRGTSPSGAALASGTTPGTEAAETSPIDDLAAGPANADDNAASAGANGADGAPQSWPHALPSAGTPVAEAFDELYARAKRGDMGAACWLGQELQRCAQARTSATYAADMERMAAQQSETPDRAVGMITNMEARARQLGEGCADLQPEQLDKAFELRLSAAKAKPELRVPMVLEPSLDRANFLGDLERWAEYKRLALPWLEQAAHEGDAPALIVLARIYGDHRVINRSNPPFRIRDDAKFVMYSDLMARYGIVFPAAQADLDAARARLSIEARTAVAQQVDALVKPEIAPLTESEKFAELGRSYGARPDVSVCDAP